MYIHAHVAPCNDGPSLTPVIRTTKDHFNPCCPSASSSCRSPQSLPTSPHFVLRLLPLDLLKRRQLGQEQIARRLQRHSRKLQARRDPDLSAARYQTSGATSLRCRTRMKIGTTLVGTLHAPKIFGEKSIIAAIEAKRHLRRSDSGGEHAVLS